MTSKVVAFLYASFRYYNDEFCTFHESGFFIPNLISRAPCILSKRLAFCCFQMLSSTFAICFFVFWDVLNQLQTQDFAHSFTL